MKSMKSLSSVRMATSTILDPWVDPKWGQGVRTPSPPEKSQNMGFLSITGLNPMENLKTTKLAFNVRPLSARQQKAISMAFRRRADDGPLKVVLGSAILN